MVTQLSSGTVLIADDDEQSLSAVRALLAPFGFKSVCASSQVEAMRLLEKHEREIDCVLTDLYMTGVSGEDLLMHIRQTTPELPVVVVAGNADVPSAVTAIREGAFDFQLKPLSSETLTLALGRAIEHRRLKNRNRDLEQRLEASQRFSGIVGNESFNEARSRFERGYLDQVLEESAGNLSQAARRSGMDRSNFRRLLERHGVRPAHSSLD